MLSRLFSRRKSSPNVDLEAFRNAALVAWIKTVPSEERLADFLKQVPNAMRDDVERSARAIFDAADRYLDEAAKQGEVDLEAFHPKLEEHLKSGFPWMTGPTFEALRSYTGWYAWHEGYVASAR